MPCFVSHNSNRVAVSLLTNEGIEAALHDISIYIYIYISLPMEKQHIKLIMNFEKFCFTQYVIYIYPPPLCSMETRGLTDASNSVAFSLF
jgi:hypothetical protein